MGTLGRAAYTVGFWIRETGQAMDRLGSRLQGNNYFKEQHPIVGIMWQIVNWNFWIQRQMREQCRQERSQGSDVNSISIGSGTNIQDHSLVHVAKSNLPGKVHPTVIGNNVTVGCGLTNGLERNRFVAHTQLYSNLKDTKTVSSKTDAQEMAAFLNGNGNGSRHRQTQTSYINYRRCCLNFEVSYLPTKRTHGNGLAMHQEFSQLSP
ncbi:Bacterial transferase hexapeptide repeat-containing protein [Artemisia annua]|uniref:Bacterial transferase hexapeptide repeat-containing protein n=1 Tax=Artemisia annua TaxID=35608 RepID=A0A2U1NXQ2_ARTAN|nr:Bacterial transferase hexapeptide repeat-containing protein [Artemisia annua]